MPQPTTNSWPFEVKEAPSADGHTGGVVAGVGAVEGEAVGDKLADTETPGVAEDIGAGPVNGLLIEPEVLVLEDAIAAEEIEREVAPLALTILEVLVLEGT